MSGHDYSTGWFREDGTPMSEDDVREAMARQAMAQDAFARDFRRLIFDELDEDQLETLQYLFSLLTATANTEVLVNWYEGLIEGARHSRRRARELDSSPTPSRDCHAFQADAEDPDVFWACTARFDDMPCGRERDHQSHLSWDAGGGLGQ